MVVAAHIHVKEYLVSVLNRYAFGPCMIVDNEADNLNTFHEHNLKGVCEPFPRFFGSSFVRHYRCVDPASDKRPRIRERFFEDFIGKRCSTVLQTQ